jgi:hypothetical protein
LLSSQHLHYFFFAQHPFFVVFFFVAFFLVAITFHPLPFSDGIPSTNCSKHRFCITSAHSNQYMVLDSLYTTIYGSVKTNFYIVPMAGYGRGGLTGFGKSIFPGC